MKFIDELAEYDVLVDTNVLNAANRGFEQAGAECVLNCARLLQHVMTSDVVVLVDAHRRILSEYEKQSYLKRPGPGREFLKWLYLNQANPNRCVSVTVTPKNDNELDFEEFPDHPELADFDDDDRKFVAVAHAHEQPAAICEAVDTDWWGWKEALEETGIAVIFSCEDYKRRQWEEDYGDG